MNYVPTLRVAISLQPPEILQNGKPGVHSACVLSCVPSPGLGMLWSVGQSLVMSFGGQDVMVSREGSGSQDLASWFRHC